MRSLRLPLTHLDVSALCLGTGGFGTETCGAEADALVATFLEAGGTFFDTAHVYGGWIEGATGASERELAASLTRVGGWDRAVVATKGGHPQFGDFYLRPDAYLSPEVIAGDISASLRNLGRERIDLYFLHRDDLRMSVAEIVEMMNREVRSGRIRHFGASNWSVERIAEANAYAEACGLQGFVASEVQWSLAVPNWNVTEDPTPRYVGTAEREWHARTGMPVVAYSATACGYFAEPPRPNGQFDSDANSERRSSALAVAKELGCTPTQVALAWLLHQPFPVVPLFSTRKVGHLAEAVGSLEVRLTASHVEGLAE